jgi:hypothetical protein
MDLRTVVLLGLTLAPGAYSQDSSYMRESSRVYDAARVAEPQTFTAPILLKEFKGFVGLQCANRKLARLTVAPTKEDLVKVVNKIWFADGLTRRGIAGMVVPNLGKDADELRAAQVLCVGDYATAIIRNGHHVERFQLSGSQDSRAWKAQGMDLTLEGFHVRGDEVEGWVSAFIRAKDLPNLETAAVVRDELEHRTGVRIDMVLRTDPFFFDVDGPKFDAFEVPAPKISVDEFLSRPYISCPPSDGRRRPPCRLETTH